MPALPSHDFPSMRATAHGASRLPLATVLFGLVGLLAVPAAAQVFDPGPSDSALFDTVINLPPDPDIGSGQSIGGEQDTEGNPLFTQVNLGDGGFINSSFDVREGAELNVRGGRINTNLDIRTGGELNVSGGQIGFTLRAFDGSFVTMTGGLIDQSFEVRSGATMLLRGGALSRRFRARAGSDLTLFGNDYKLNGEDFSIPLSREITLVADDVFTGTLEDGSAFVFSPQAGDVFLDVTLQQSLVPSADPTPIVVDTVNPVRPSGVRAGQTLTLRDGGELPENFEAVDATVNIEGGVVDDDSGFSRSTVNISGGRFEAFSQAYAGTTINLTGGQWGSFSDAHSGSIVNVIGGTLDSFFEAQAGSTINLNLGVVERGFTALAGSIVDVAGGAIGFDFDIEEGSDAELIGGEFRLNGEAFTGSTLTLGENDVFTATLADGSSHIFAGNRSDDITGLKLVPVSLPTLDLTPRVINTADHGRPSGLRAGQTLTVQEGGVLGNYFEMIEGSTLTIDGGILGENAAVLGGTINLNSGRINRALVGGVDSVVNLAGGSTGNQFEAQAGSTFNISGGDIGSGFTALEGSVINISGGTFDEELVADGGTLNITGGDLGPDFEVNSGSVVNISGGTIGTDVRFEFGSQINLLGTGFMIGGSPVVLSGQNFANAASDSVLSGVFADGTPFSFDFSEDDLLSSGARLTLSTPFAIPGDYNSDGSVDAADYTVWRDAVDRGSVNLAADGNRDGQVNDADYLVWRDNFGRQAGTSTSATTAIPEPATLVLLGLGGFALLARRMR